VARLFINNRQQEGSSATVLADARQALLPLLLHPAPRRALFLGLGTGVTASSAAADPTLHVTAVELLPEVIEASRHFTQAAGGGGAPPSLHVIAADARRFVKTSTQRFDLIVSDNFHPARSGSGALYTVEHFAAVRARLAERGVFCQWLPLHQLDIDTLRSIVRSFTAVYPDGWAMLATNSLETPVLGLVARRDGARFELREVRKRLARSTLPQPLADFGLPDDFALLGSFVAGPSALARFAADAPLNTDDRPVVAYRAPRITYAPDSRPAERLTALLRELRIAPQELLDAGADAAWQARLAAYWRARQRYIDVGQQVRASNDPRRMLSQVREPLLEVLRLSPDFRPAREPLQRMAAVLARSDPAAARALQDELARLQPMP
jgi:spermidine synthase